jgi:hypothetical protein
MPPLSAASPLTASVLILRGSLFGIVPLAAAGIGADGDTLAAGGGWRSDSAAETHHARPRTSN